MNEYYYGINADRIITPFGFVQMKLNDKPIEFIYNKIPVNGTVQAIHPLGYI